MTLAKSIYAAGVVCFAAAGFLSPLYYLGFIPLSVGLIWAALNLVEVTGGEPPSAPQRTRDL